MMNVERKCPKCGEGKMSTPRFNRYEDCLNRTCTTCGYMSYEATYDSKKYTDAEQRLADHLKVNSMYELRMADEDTKLVGTSKC